MARTQNIVIFYISNSTHLLLNNLQATQILAFLPKWNSTVVLSHGDFQHGCEKLSKIGSRAIEEFYLHGIKDIDVRPLYRKLGLVAKTHTYKACKASLDRNQYSDKA